MSYSLISLSNDSAASESVWFFEGAVLAANMSRTALDPDTWLSQLLDGEHHQLKSLIVAQIHQQYHAIKTNSYLIGERLSQPEHAELLADFAEGFMTVWPLVEEAWQSAPLADGTLRMLQALLTTMMLAINEAQTQQQMREAGIEQPPRLTDLLAQLDLMINEVALSADEALAGSQAQRVNPFKETGRNDPCPCGSGKKFKQCCGH